MIDWLVHFLFSGVFVTLFTLTFLEILLGIDNMLLIAVLAERLPIKQQESARKIGLFLALFSRLLMLSSVLWLVHLQVVLFNFMGHGYNMRDLLLFLGGLFLVYKALSEIIVLRQEQPHRHKTVKQRHTFMAVLVQIILLDIIFSIDTVLTAVALTDILWVMMLAVILAVGIMLLGIDYAAKILRRHRRIKVLALGFLMVLGMMLALEGLNLDSFGKGLAHTAKAYLYSAMFFTLFIEFLTLWVFHKDSSDGTTQT